MSAITLGAPLRPIARLTALRRRTELVVGGKSAAEVDEDSVEGTVVAGQGSGTVAFKEVEVELAPGGSREVLDAVVERLLASGARRSARSNKLWTVLQSAPHSGLPVEEVSTLASAEEAPQPKKPASMADVLAQQACSCLWALVEHDPPIRLGDPDLEHVHRARVATRRLRSVLWSLGRLRTGASVGSENDFGPGGAARAWLASLRRELRWLGGAFGAARDADVRLAVLESDCANLDPLDQAAAQRVLEFALSEKAVAHRRLLEAMSEERYLALLRSLDALSKGLHRPSGPESRPAGGDAAPPELWQHLDVPAGPAMAQLGAAQWRSVRRAARRLGDPPSDQALHRLRIETKRLRYIAEAAAPVVQPSSSRRAAVATAVAATDLQDVLGELHDAIVNDQWLRDLAGAAATWAGNGTSGDPAGVALVAGQLLAMRRATAARGRKAWRRQWHHLYQHRLTRWAEA